MSAVPLPHRVAAAWVKDVQGCSRTVKVNSAIFLRLGRYTLAECSRQGAGRVCNVHKNRHGAPGFAAPEAKQEMFSNLWTKIDQSNALRTADRRKTQQYEQHMHSTHQIAEAV